MTGRGDFSMGAPQILVTISLLLANQRASKCAFRYYFVTFVFHASNPRRHLNTHEKRGVEAATIDKRPAVVLIVTATA